MKIVSSVSNDRDLLGQLTLYDVTGLVTAGPFWILARADYSFAGNHGNPGANSLKCYGNTPTGTFSVTGLVPSGDGTALMPVRSYGPNGALVLVPMEGQALVALQNGGRTGFLVHGGDLSPNAPNNTLLRPTHGCIRMANDDVATLVAALQAAGAAYPFDLEVNEDFTGAPPAVVISDDPDPDDVSDPPPNV